jgi:hypothetical protein
MASFGPACVSSFNQITAHNAGWPSQFRFADGVLWPGVCEFVRHSLMLPIITLLSVALVVGWAVAEFKSARPVRISVGFAVFAFVGYAAYLGGRVAADLQYLTLSKERVILSGSMHKIEELLARGDTATVTNAVAAYYRRAEASTNEFGYYQASFELWEALKERK